MSLQKTSIEELEKEIRRNVSNSDKLIEIFRIAKEKEKKQIIKSYEDGYSDGKYENGLDNGKEYYNETFKK